MGLFTFLYHFLIWNSLSLLHLLLAGLPALLFWALAILFWMFSSHCSPCEFHGLFLLSSWLIFGLCMGRLFSCAEYACRAYAVYLASLVSLVLVAWVSQLTLRAQNHQTGRQLASACF